MIAARRLLAAFSPPRPPRSQWPLNVDTCHPECANRGHCRLPSEQVRFDAKRPSGLQVDPPKYYATSRQRSRRSTSLHYGQHTARGRI
jgi:hypothetical protein